MDTDRFAGALLGVHVGDSLGATTEFTSRTQARRMLPANIDDAEIVGGGTFGWTAGAATDDTDLTLALVRAYLATDIGASDAVVEAAADHMLRWMQADPRDIGGTTSQGLRTYERSRDPFRSGVDHGRSQGNGSLMRTVPVALARAHDANRRAAEASALSAITHAHVVCRDACVVYCDLIAGLVIETFARDRETLRGLVASGAADPRSDPRVGAALDAAVDRPVGAVEGVNDAASGWVLTALGLTVAALLDERPAAEVLLEVVRLGGDADTNGAIVGGMLGARDGLSAWPDRWLAALEHHDELTTAARRFADR